jgi:hypothetical protein
MKTQFAVATLIALLAPSIVHADLTDEVIEVEVGRSGVNYTDDLRKQTIDAAWATARAKCRKKGGTLSNTGADWSPWEVTFRNAINPTLSRYVRCNVIDSLSARTVPHCEAKLGFHCSVANAGQSPMDTDADTKVLVEESTPAPAPEAESLKAPGSSPSRGSTVLIAK